MIFPIITINIAIIATLCQKIFFQDVEYHYDNSLEKLNLETLHIRLRHFDAMFLINVFSGTRHCPSVLETVDIRVFTRNIRNLTSSVAPSATALQLDVFLPQMQFVNLQIFLVSYI
jgi:hypothetical protein